MHQKNWCKVSRVKENNIKNCTYFFFDDMINMKNLYPDKFKINQKP